MRTTADHMAMARKTLAFARSVLSDDYADKAGREAYLAGYQAAMAFIFDRKLRRPGQRNSVVSTRGNEEVDTHPKERRNSGQSDLFRALLDQIVDLNHELVRLGGSIDWRFLKERFGAVYTDAPGHPLLPTQLMAALAILKAMPASSPKMMRILH